MTEKRSKDLVVGAVVGSVLGAVTALLFAPKSGRELRTDIKDGYQQVSGKTQEVAGEVVEKSKQIITTIGEKSQAAAQSVKAQTTELSNKAKDVTARIGHEVKSWRAPKSTGTEQALESAEASIAATIAEQEEK